MRTTQQKERTATMVSAIIGNQSLSTWRGAQGLFVLCDIIAWKGLHHRLRCRWGRRREKTWSATWCPFHQLHPPETWNYQCWDKAPCACCWMRTFLLLDGLHELPAALPIYSMLDETVKCAYTRGREASLVSIWYHGKWCLPSIYVSWLKRCYCPDAIRQLCGSRAEA